jgi:hypothetical protein
MECGSNYARSLSSWGIVPVCSGFTFDLAAQRIGFAPRLCRDGGFSAPFSLGTAWGEIRIGDGRLELEIASGELTIAHLDVAAGDAELSRNGRPLASRQRQGDLSFEPTTFRAGDLLTLVSSTLTLSGAFDTSRPARELH